MSEIKKEQAYKQPLNWEQVDSSSYNSMVGMYPAYVVAMPTKSATKEDHLYYGENPVTKSNIDNQAKIGEPEFKFPPNMSYVDYIRQQNLQQALSAKLSTEDMIEKAEQEEFEKFMEQTGTGSKNSSSKPSLKKKVVGKKDFVPFPYMGEKTKATKVKKEEEDIVINKDEELIINIEELADELAVENQKDKNDNKEYSELLKKYKKLILKHERTKKQ
jgi:hypothetical protein